MAHRKTTPPASAPTEWAKIAPYALVSLGCFLLGAMALGAMLWYAERLHALGLTGKFYYVVLLPLSLSVAGFLFGVLRSYAVYRGRQLGGVLELRGPAMAAALVVAGGFFLVPNVETFPLTVFVHGESGPQEAVLKNSGYVVIDLGPERRREPIGDRGQAYFPAIPARFRGQYVNVGLDSDDFEAIDAHQKQPLDDDNLYLAVRRRNGRIYGRIQDPDGNPIPDAEIRVAGISSRADSFGEFEITIPGNRIEPQLELTVVAAGYGPKRYPVVSDGNRVIITLERE